MKEQQGRMEHDEAEGDKPMAVQGMAPIEPVELDLLDTPVRLIDLLEPRSRRILLQAGRDLGVPVSVVDLEGGAIVGRAVPAYVSGSAGPILDLVPASEGTDHWLVQQLLHEGEPVGILVVGPFTEEERGRVCPVAQHLADLTDELIGAGLEKLFAARMHTMSMATAYQELQQKNMRLHAAVERLQQLDKVKSNFLATVSHELRTPLTSVIGYSEMLLEGLAGPLNEEQSEYVRTVMEKGEQLLNIITGILDISRIEAGGVRLDRAPCRMDEIIDVAISTVAPAARRKGLTVQKRLRQELPLIDADRDKVRQVLLNLLSNAVKFTPEGGEVWVDAEVAPLRRPAPCDCGPGDEEEERRAVRVMVADSGIGIPREAMGKIFDPFYQVDSSSTREFGGTGLGLAIVKSFVHAHGGSVWVESVPGKGSRFYVTLPVAR